MEYVKKHKFTMFVILIYIVIVIFGFFVYKAFFANNGEPVYGDRLDGIDKVEIKDDQLKKIKDEINSNDDKVMKVDQINVIGKTLNIIVTFSDGVSANDAKSIANNILKTKNLTKEQLEFYDIQVFLNKEINCYLVATGKMDDDGIFTNEVKVSFVNDPSSNKNITAFGLANSKTKDYNSKKSYAVNSDNKYTIYGFIKDKLGKEYSCSVSFTRKNSSGETEDNKKYGTKIENFPIIGYRKAAASGFSWTKDR